MIQTSHYALRRTVPFRRPRWFTFAALLSLMGGTASVAASQQPDVAILSNGSQLNGEFVRSVGETVTFHDETLGDVQLKWPQINELRTGKRVAVILEGQEIGKKTPESEIRSGILRMADRQIILTVGTETVATIPIADAAYVVDQTTLEKELRGSPGWINAWNGAVTAGASMVQAAQNSTNFDGSMSLTRSVPTVSWLLPRNRTKFLLTGASGRITQPSYVASSSGSTIAAQRTKTDVYHLGIQRDQYFSSRVYYFGTAQFDHNFSQNLQLQQLYGAGLGITTINTPRQTLDLTTNIQYVRQTFIESAPGDDKNLVGSTVSANYTVRLTDGMVFNQYVAYLPAFNDGDAYSVISRNTLTLPAYRNFRVVVGTVNSYLNSVAMSEPPSRRNSFQATFGLSYDIKTSY